MKFYLVVAFFALCGSSYAQITPIEAKQANPQVMKQLREMNAYVEHCKQNNLPKEAEKSQLAYNEFAAQHILEARILSEQLEQEAAARNLSPADYDAWKRNKHNTIQPQTNPNR